jgi:hypothetical protein
MKDRMRETSRTTRLISLPTSRTAIRPRRNTTRKTEDRQRPEDDHRDVKRSRDLRHDRRDLRHDRKGTSEARTGASPLGRGGSQAFLNPSA